MSAEVDCALLKELSQNIEKLTHSGEKSLEEKCLKEVKNVCKLSDGYVERAYDLVMHQMGQNHAEIRFSALQLCSEIFQRSHVFRKLLVSNLQEFLEMTVETCPDRPLPPPRSVALNLKNLTLQTVHEWNKVFGKKYRELQLACNFLKLRKKVDFAALEMETSAERARQQEIENRKKCVNEERVRKVRLEMKELESEMRASVAALENCISLLLPPPDEFFIDDGEGASDLSSSTAGSAIPAVTVNRSTCVRRVGEQPGNAAVPKTSANDVGSDSFESGTDESETDGPQEEVDLRKHGMFNTNYNIEIKLKPGDANKIRVTDENSVIVENARDHVTLINKRYLPCVKKWSLILTKSSGTPADLKKVSDLKQSLEAVVSKFLKLELQKPSQAESCDSSDSDFEDVEEKDGYEETAKAAPLPVTESPSAAKTGRKHETSEWNIVPKEHEKEDPTTAQSTISKLLATKAPSLEEKSAQEQSGTSSTCDDAQSESNATLSTEPQPSTSQTVVDERKAKLLAIAPKLPFDVDLYHWEDEKLTAPTMLSVKAENSRFWSSTNIDEMEEIPVPEGSASLRTRVIEFTGKFEPVKKSCRAPLGNGKLCPRHDRYKCPFHGPIVPRDETGKCVNQDDEKQPAETSENEVQQCPDWQDPQLLADIKAATGIDLKMPEKKKGKKKKQVKPKEKKYPGLTDVKVKQNTAINRLSKKVFKKSAMKRVASALDKLDRKRFRDKYGDQFNYMY